MCGLIIKHYSSHGHYKIFTFFLSNCNYNFFLSTKFQLNMHDTINISLNTIWQQRICHSFEYWK